MIFLYFRVITIIMLFYSALAFAGDPPLSPLSDEYLLLMQPILDDVPYETTIAVYHVGSTYFLPLKALAEIGELGINVTPKTGKAEGWIVNNTQSFLLNIEAKKIIINGKTLSFPADKIVYNEEDIFIEQHVLESWLPLSFSANIHSLILSIKASVLLPGEQKNARKEQWERLKKPPPPRLYLQKKIVPYQLLSWPFIDISAGHSYSRTATDKHMDYNYSLRAGGDMGYLNTQIFASGEQENALNTLRLTAGRQDNDATLLGPLKATEFALGDINSVSIPLIASIGEGRGFMLSNRMLNRSSDIDSTHFTGDAMPGTDVELYRNGILLNAEAIGEDGRYEFTHVPLLFGNNSFRLVFYGPQGQRHEETKNIMTSDSMLHKGDFSYDFSLNEKYKSLLPLANDSRRPFSFVSTMINGEETTERLAEQEGIRLIGLTEYGLTDHITTVLGAAHIPLATDSHDYITTGLRTNILDSILISQDIGQNISIGGMVEKTSLLTNVRGVNLKAEHSIYSHFTDELEEQQGKILRTASLGEMTMPIPYFSNVNTGITFRNQQFIEGEREISLLHRLSTSYKGLSMSNAIGRVENQTPGIKTLSTNGQVAVSGPLKEITLRAAGSYSLTTPSLTALGLSAQKKLKKNLVLVTGASQELASSNRISAFSSLNWDIGKAKISLKLDGDNDGDAFIGTNVNFSLARAPSSHEWYMQSESIASSGGVEARSFLDKNNDGIFNGTDEWIPHTSIKAGPKKITTPEGNAFGVGIAAAIATEVSMDETTLEDPLWISPHKGYVIVPRPGIVTPLTFPVIASSEIEGSVSHITVKGKAPLPRITIQLVDKEGKIAMSTHSEFDGFYSFERVVPGNYLLQIAPEALTKKHLTANSYKLTVSGMGDVYSGRDFTVTTRIN